MNVIDTLTEEITTTLQRDLKVLVTRAVQEAMGIGNTNGNMPSAQPVTRRGLGRRGAAMRKAGKKTTDDTMQARRLRQQAILAQIKTPKTLRELADALDARPQGIGSTIYGMIRLGMVKRQGQKYVAKAA